MDASGVRSSCEASATNWRTRCLALVSGLQRALDVVEEVVEREADLADLGMRVGVLLGNPRGQRDGAGVELELGDLARRPGHPVERLEVTAHEEAAAQEDGDETDGGAGHDEGEEVGHGLVDALGRHAGDEDDPGGGAAGHQEVAADVAAEVDAFGLEAELGRLELVDLGLVEGVVGALVVDDLVDPDAGERVRRDLAVDEAELEDRTGAAGQADGGVVAVALRRLDAEDALGGVA